MKKDNPGTWPIDLAALSWLTVTPLAVSDVWMLTSYHPKGRRMGSSSMLLLSSIKCRLWGFAGAIVIAIVVVVGGVGGSGSGSGRSSRGGSIKE